MKIAYLIHWNEGPDSGVFKKVLAQAREWRALQHEPAMYLFTSRSGDEWREAEEAGIRIIAETYRGKLGRQARFKVLLAKLRAWQPDIVYHRFDLYYPSLPRLLREVPSVLEINTNDVAELVLEKKKSGLRYGYHLLTRRLVLTAPAGFVFVSGELAEAAPFRRFVEGKAVKVIGNGINLQQHETTQGNTLPWTDAEAHEAAGASVESSVRFVFIGSAGQTWHGVDQIAELAAVKPDWGFDVIGMDRSELAQPVPDNMHFHGKLLRSRYQPLLDQADIAIGTLALYRKGMEEASPLKVREYLANGLPVITAYRETDFSEPVPFVLQLPNEPGNMVRSLGEIEQFVHAWKGRRVEREDVRHLDTAVKEAARIEFMERIITSRKRGSEPCPV
ncbi:glycosyltransferase [Paenibacillus puldeungensis]|uniref:Glycosyltransferase n=1 Tax=Paenibacillus puldeungensis TaxID=696536 RepID=A0ABW3RV66_9BACL